LTENTTEKLEQGERVKNETANIGEKEKSAWETIEGEAMEIVESAKEIAEEVWDDVKGIFGQGDKKNPKSQEDTANNGTKAEEEANAASTEGKRY
jgi:hypothetical protein